MVTIDITLSGEDKTEVLKKAYEFVDEGYEVKQMTTFEETQKATVHLFKEEKQDNDGNDLRQNMYEEE